MLKKITKDVKPKVTPSMCGMVFIIPKLKPEYEATTLFGPGVYAVTNQNKAIESISGCIFMRLGVRFLIYEMDELKLLFPLYQLILELILEK